MTDEMDAWNANWLQLKTRGTDTSELSTELVLGAFRGANAFQQLTVLEQADDDEKLGDIVYGALRLCCALARHNRTATGLMEICAMLHDLEENAPTQRTRSAARLVLAHQIADDVANFDGIDGLDPAPFWALGANDYNDTLTDAGTLAPTVVITALELWQRLLPEVATMTVKAVAARTWRTA